MNMAHSLGRQALSSSTAAQIHCCCLSGKVAPALTTRYGSFGVARRSQWRSYEQQLTQPGHCRLDPFVARAGPPSVGNSNAEDTAESRLERAVRQSYEVESRVKDIHSEEELLNCFDAAGDKLVLLEIQSDQVCETGLDEPEPEINWKLDQEKLDRERMEKCRAVKHVFQRTARQCPDVQFLAVTHDDTPENENLLKRLNVTVLPTLQFYKHRKLLWEHRGVVQMQEGMGEGVMYYDGSTSPSSKLVKEIRSRDDLMAFLRANMDDRVLTVINVATTSAKPCIKVFPAVVALAQSFQGFAVFGRLMVDANEECQQLMKELSILEVPTFLFFRAGREVGRHVGSSRGDLIGQILQQQASFGVSPPPPPVTASPRMVKRKVASERKWR